MTEPTERDKTAAAFLRTTPEAVRDLRVHREGEAPPRWVGPDCAVGKHDACAGEALNEDSDEIVPCQCFHHHLSVVDEAHAAEMTPSGLTIIDEAPRDALRTDPRKP